MQHFLTKGDSDFFFLYFTLSEQGKKTGKAFGCFQTPQIGHEVYLSRDKAVTSLDIYYVVEN